MLTQLCFYGNQASKYLFEHGLYDFIKEMNTKEFRVKMLEKSKEHTEYAYQLLQRHKMRDITTKSIVNEKLKRVFMKIKVQKSLQPMIQNENTPIIKHIVVSFKTSVV